MVLKSISTLSSTVTLAGPTLSQVTSQPEFDEEYEYDEFEDEEELDQLYDERRNKLMSRPPKAKPKCGKALAKNDASEGSEGTTSTAVDKLSMRQKTPLDLIKLQIPKPEGSVPKTALPIWYEFSMDEKIPLIPAPAGYIYYSRGKLCQPLHRCHPFYTLLDPRNLERVVGARYTALHDPHARRVMCTPIMKAMLKKQKLINDTDEVLCTLQEFNKSRNYLRTQYNDEVQRAVSAKDTSSKWDREQLVEIYKFQSNSEGRSAMLKSRRLKALQNQAESAQRGAHSIQAKHDYMDKQLAKWEEEKARENMRRIQIGFEKEKKQAERMYRLEFNRLEDRRNILQKATLKDIEVSQRRISDAKIMARAIEKFKIEWIDLKLEFCKARIEKDKQTEESIREVIKAKSAKRQRQVEHNRAMMPARLEKKKEGEKRLWEIVRKYAMRWLEKVRKRLNAPKDVLHESVWIGKSKGVLDDTLKYLKELSGYEKMDDFVLNIIKLKRQIQHQIELEEAQEAAEEAERAKLAKENRNQPTSGESEGEAEDEASSSQQIPTAFEQAMRAEAEAQKQNE